MFEVSTYAQPFFSCLINLWMILFPSFWSSFICEWNYMEAKC